MSATDHIPNQRSAKAMGTTTTKTKALQPAKSTAVVTAKTARSLKQIEADIQAAIPELGASVTQAAEHMRRIGELLLEGKRQLPHGEFTSWITAKFPFTDRHARNLMRLAEKWKTVQPQLADRKHVSVFRLMSVHDIDSTKRTNIVRKKVEHNGGNALVLLNPKKKVGTAVVEAKKLTFAWDRLPAGHREVDVWATSDRHDDLTTFEIVLTGVSPA